jgi:hypothetical protein
MSFTRRRTLNFTKKTVKEKTAAKDPTTPQYLLALATVQISFGGQEREFS